MRGTRASGLLLAHLGKVALRIMRTAPADGLRTVAVHRADDADSSSAAWHSGRGRRGDERDT